MAAGSHREKYKACPFEKPRVLVMQMVIDSAHAVAGTPVAIAAAAAVPQLEFRWREWETQKQLAGDSAELDEFAESEFAVVE